MAATRVHYNSMNEWQGRWDSDQKSRYTHTLISDLQAWTEQQHGEVDFYLTQFLAGHGYFCDMLKNWHKGASKQCLNFPGENDTVEHTFFGCVRYSEGRPLFPIWRPEGVVPEMLRSPQNWDKVAEYARATLLAKKEEGFLS